MITQVIQFHSRRRPAATGQFPPDACTRAARSESPRALPSATEQNRAVTPLSGTSPARVQRVTFFSKSYNPVFVERAAIVLGYLGLAVIGFAEWAGAL